LAFIDCWEKLVMMVDVKFDITSFSAYPELR